MSLLQPANPGRGVLIFGREPAGWVGVIEAALAFLLMVGWLHFIGLNTAQDTAIFMAAVDALLAVYVAYATHHTTTALIVGAAKALLSLATVYGFHLTPDHAAAAIGFLSVALAFYNKQVTTPLADVARARLAAQRVGTSTA
jgi:hypothetical protein